MTGPSLADLTAAVLAEGYPVDLSGAVRRAGDENVVLETAEWIYRFPKPGIDFDREIRLLGALHGRLPVTTPYVEWVGTKSRFCAYRKVTGWRLDRDVYRSATRSRQQLLAGSLAEYLAAIHQVRISGRVLLHDDFTTDNLVFDDEMGRLSGAFDFSHSCIGPAHFDFRYLTYEPDPLTSDVIVEYERTTGVEIDQEAFVVAGRVADVLRHIRHNRRNKIVAAVRGWQ